MQAPATIKKRRVTERIELSKATITDPISDTEIKSGDSDDLLLGKPRAYTVSVAIPGSIVANAQSQELRTYLVGQLARALVIYNIDEVVVYDDNMTKNDTLNQSTSKTSNLAGYFEPASNIINPHLFLARVLQYLETPQYLRKQLFPIHKDLQFAGLLNPLDCPHHLRATEVSKYREGLVLNKPIKQNRGSFVNCGLRKDVSVDKSIKPGTRVTVQLDESDRDPSNVKGAYLQGKVTSSRTPKEQDGIYWGYQVRLAPNLSSVFDSCPYKDGYDLKLGTSERGSDIDQFHKEMPKFKHLLVVLGGVQGIEAAVDADQSLKVSGSDSKELFDFWLNTCPRQGSRTIRTEEALLVTMSALRPSIESNGQI